MKRAKRTSSKHPHEGHTAGPGEYDRDVQSVAYFNDAVFAIAMTLLVVGIRVPSGTSAETLGHALRGLGPSFASYGISFIVLGFYWLGSHRQLHYMEHFNGGALVIDLLFLMSVAFLPFPTLLLNNYSGPVPVIFYASSMASTGILLAVLWIYSGRRGLLRNVDARLNSYYTLRAVRSADLPTVDPSRGRFSAGSHVRLDPRLPGPANPSAGRLPLSHPVKPDRGVQHLISPTAAQAEL